jgi:TRAP-type C4-dicarboxylate transport system substrate-binding protein
LPSSHYIAEWQQEWADLVEANSDGRIEVQVYPAAQLYSDRDAMEAISTGALEAGAFYIHNIAPVVHEWEAVQAMGLPWSQDLIIAMLEGDVGAKLRQASEEANLKVICYLPWGLSGISMGIAGQGDPILLPEDLQGRKIRATYSAMADFDAAYGGYGVTLAGAELYTALQRGTADALVAASSHVIERKLWEVSDWYVAPVPYMGDQITQMYVNLDFFNSLPADLQQVLTDAGEEIYQKHKDDGVQINLDFVDQMTVEKPTYEVYLLTDAQWAVWCDALLPFNHEYLKQWPEAVETFNLIADLATSMGISVAHIE